MWAMMGNISKTAEPSMFIFGTDLRVGKGHHILGGVRLSLLSRNEPPTRIWQFKYATFDRLAILSPATPARPCTVVKTVLCSFLYNVFWH